MAVLDLQSWADNLELVRLPAIEEDITNLQTDLSAHKSEFLTKSQELTDRLDADDAGIAAAQSAADAADAKAQTAQGELYQGDLDNRLYTDTAIQNLRDELLQNISTVETTVQSNLETYTDGQVSSGISGIQTELDTKIAQAEQIRSSMQTEVDAVNAANDHLLNTELPTINTALNGVQIDANATQGELDALLADYSNTTLLAGLNDVQTKAEQNIQSLGAEILRLPASLWTIESTTASLIKAPPPESWFIDNDPDFVECMAFGTGTDETIGQSYPVEFDPNDVYKIKFRFKVINDGTLSGVKFACGVSTFAGDTQLETNQQTDSSFPGTYTVANGTITGVFWVSADETRLNRRGLSATDANVILLTGSNNANKAFFHLRQNLGSQTDGQASVAQFRIQNITDAIDASDEVRIELQAEVDGVTADLTSNYYTSVQTDGEISTAINQLQTTLSAEIDNDVGVVATDLSQNYYTAVQTDGEISTAVSALETTLSADINAVSSDLSTNYRTAVDTDTAIAQADTNLKTEIENPAGSSVGATLANNYRTTSNTDIAIAAADTALKAEIEDPNGASLGATVNTQATTIADIEGNLTAGYLVKAQAGGAVSLLDLVAADDGTSPPTSIAKISANDIILDGTVFTEKLVIGDASLEANVDGGLIIKGGGVTVLEDNNWANSFPMDGNNGLIYVGYSVLTVPPGLIADTFISLTFGHGYNGVAPRDSGWGYLIYADCLRTNYDEENAANLTVGNRCKIATLGDTDWNAAAGTTGVTYAVGDYIDVLNTPSGTGTAYDRENIPDSVYTAPDEVEVGDIVVISYVGDTDWNTMAGTTGVTYEVGDFFQAASTIGTAGSGGCYTDRTITVRSRYLTLMQLENDQPAISAVQRDIRNWAINTNGWFAYNVEWIGESSEIRLNACVFGAFARFK